ncbi:TetR/AcrR family transcriptional regulator [Roseococcus sp. SYP-B2431]|uniref:TetR/AcrR family transcriptional regulator n=1 Tax=Roseococcus sp. SYP-B2431 TaxID=2496640 RepID=UPI0013F4A31F|nr:TetR family transcriptional regulator [Roseococcus sp. SYP-B2431]
MAARDDILAIATDLFTRHGFNGVSYADIARSLGMTTANIHYHFGTKLGLASAALEAYADQVTERMRCIWCDEGSNLESKIKATISFTQDSYNRFNGDGPPGRAWSLMSRFASDADALDDDIRKRITAFRSDAHAFVSRGVDIAMDAGEFRDDAPRAEMARILSSAFLYAPHIARDTGGFAGAIRNYAAVHNMMRAAYGVQSRPSRRAKR